jgi:uncharacterized membrane protein YgcG
MISLRRQNSDLRPAVEPRLFREAMSRPAVARELFLPLDQAWWDGGRFTLGRWAASAPRPTLRGVRIQEPAPDSAGPPPERDTQGDLCSLVDSVAELRRVPQLSGLVLSEETLIGRQKGALPGKRVLFGLHCPPSVSFQEDTPAAAECHRVLRRAVNRAGYIIVHPKEPFHPTSGLAGLREWAAAVRLRRKPDRRPWLLLLLLPLLFLPWQCLNRLRNEKGTPADPGDAAAALKSSGKGGAGSEKGQEDGGKGKNGGGGGGAGNGAGGGGNGGDGGAGKNANQGKPSQPARPLPEEAGPPTTIPSKMARPVVPTGQPAQPARLAPPFGTASGNHGPY